MSISNRLTNHFALAAVATAAVAATSNAAVVYSGIINFACAVTSSGAYINVQTNLLAGSPSDVSGWDVNVYTPNSPGSTLDFYGTTGGGMMRYPGLTTGTAGNLALGTSIGGTGSYNNSSTSGINTHVVFGATAGQWQYSADNIVGFKFIAADTLTHYGWMRFAIGAAGSSGTSMTRTVVDYGWESTAGASILAGAGAVPAPGAIALLGLVGLVRGRRRA